jgi:tetratricopeptide (TPR) repeat protein
MDRIIDLVQSLKESEVKLLRVFYQGKPEHTEFENREKLFVLALSKPDCTDQEAKRYLFGRKDSSAFARVKQRVRTDILNILILQETESKFKSKYAQAVFNCRRAIIQGDVLLSRGVYDAAMEVLMKASTLAEDNELYAEQVMINDLYRTHMIIKDQGKYFGKVSGEIDKSIMLLGKSAEAKQDHYEIILPGLDGVPPGPDHNLKAKKKLDKMKSDFESTGSLRIGFYYYLSATHYYRVNFDFLLSLFHGQKLLELVKISPAFQSDSFVGGANMEIANTLISLERYEEALQYADIALDRFKPGMLNELMALEKVYFCHIRLGDLHAARSVITRAFQNKKIRYNEFTNAKWWLFRAAVEFQSGNYAKAINSMKNCDPLLKDKNGWLLGFIILELMCRTENGNLGWFDYRAESLKKIIQRYIKNSSHDGDRRIELVFKIMRTLRRLDYNFEKLLDTEKTNLGILKRGEGAYYRNPSGYEIIRFEEWIFKKAQEEKIAMEGKKRKTVSKV